MDRPGQVQKEKEQQFQHLLSTMLPQSQRVFPVLVNNPGLQEAGLSKGDLLITDFHEEPSKGDLCVFMHKKYNYIGRFKEFTQETVLWPIDSRTKPLSLSDIPTNVWVLFEKVVYSIHKQGRR
ncbi:MAG: hypothetical protein LUE93_10705 [Bacteroides sp.]|nr:hypothetical protein [Bacteroides sp.]